MSDEPVSGEVVPDHVTADTDPDARPSVLRNVGHMMTSQVGSWILGTIALVLVPRFLGPALVGRLHLTVSIWSIASVFVVLGTSGYLTLQMARDRHRAAALVGPIMLLRLVTFLCAALVVAVISIVSGFDAEMLVLVLLTGCAALLMSLSDVLNAALVGLERISYAALAAVIPKAVFTALLIVVLVPGGGVLAVAAMSIIHVGLSLGMLWHFYRRFEAVTWGCTRAGVWSVVRRSSGFFVAAAVIVVYLQVDTVVIATLVDEETLGWYSTADVLASSALFVPTIIMSALFPVLGRVHSIDPSEAAWIAQRALSILILAGVALGFGTVVVAEPVAVLLFGEEFRETGAVLAVLGAMMPFIFGTMMLGTIAMATDRRRFWNLMMILAIISTIGLDLVLVPWFDDVAGNGAIGGALSYLIVESIMFFVAVRQIAPGVLGVDNRTRILKIITAGGIMVVVTWSVRDLFVIVPIVLGAAVFVGMIVLFRVLTPEETELLVRIRTKVLGILSGGRQLRRGAIDNTQHVTTGSPPDPASVDHTGETP